MKVKAKNFTLIELLTVIIIIGILMSMAFVGYSRIDDSKKKRQAELQINAISTALDDFYDEKGYFPQPTGIAQIRTTTFSNEGFDFNHLEYGIQLLSDGVTFADPWNKQYYYNPVGFNVFGSDGARNNKGSYDLFSAGPDGAETAWGNPNNSLNADNIDNI